MASFRRRLFFFLPFLALSLLVSASLRAKDGEPEFAVVSTAMNPETQNPEFCLAFNRPMKPGSRATIASALRLEKDGKKVRTGPENLSLTSVDLCVQGLEHRHRYRIVLKGLESEDGLKLAKPVNVFFTVPDRKPALVFVSDGQRARLPRYAPTSPTAPFVIRAVNVPAARLTLYRFSDRKAFAEAWEQAGSLNLAPSESLYFASQKGELVWQTELKFGGVMNEEQQVETPLPFRDSMKPGLYFLAAKPVSGEAKGPAFVAGRWFLLSDVMLSALSGPDGISLFAADPEKGRVAENVSVQIVAANGSVLADGKTDKDGVAYFASSAMPSKDKPAYATGMTSSGSPAVIALEPNGNGVFYPASGGAALATDRAVYLPGSAAVVTLLMKDGNGRPVKTPDSALKLVQPDQNFYTEKNIQAGQTGAVYVTFPLPVTAGAGEWTLLWQRPDGAVLARAPLRIAPAGVWPEVRVVSGQDVLEAGGKAVLEIRASGGENAQPLPWRQGIVRVRAARPSFAGWADYRFGPEVPKEGEPLAQTAFMTSEQGNAKIQLSLPPPDKTMPHQGVAFDATMEGFAQKAGLSLPVAGPYGWIGIRPAYGEDAFPENSQASFDVVALDHRGQRRGIGEVYYQIYEEGRSFEWFQAGGRWDYRPLPQRRRVGGGRLMLTALGNTSIVWPVTAGHYLMELTSAEGLVLAQTRFHAGGRWPSYWTGEEGRLLFEKPESRSQQSADRAIILKTPGPAMASMVLEGGSKRQALHRVLQAGKNVIPFTPSAEWGDSLRVRAQAVFSDGYRSAAEGTVSLAQDDESGQLKIDVPAQVSGGARVSLPITWKEDLEKEAYVSASVTPVGEGEILAMAGKAVTRTPFDKNGKASLAFDVPAFSGQLDVTVSAWDGRRFLSRKVRIDVRQDLVLAGDLPPRLFAGDKAFFRLRLENGLAPEGSYAYEVTVPSGFDAKGDTKGKVFLGKGKSLTVPLEIEAVSAGQGKVRVDVKGPRNTVFYREWPVSAVPGEQSVLAATSRTLDLRQTLSLPVRSDEGREGGIMLAAPFPVHDLPAQWRALIGAEPLTTQELAHWLEAALSWSGRLKELDIEGSGALQDLIVLRLNMLQERQTADGGFSSWPSSASSDLASTAAALLVLHGRAPLAAEQAVRWIQRRLDNTWFEESERPARATAFLALSKAGKADLSSLRYFADTSRDKDLAALTMAELSLAFALNKDENAARSWLNRAKDAAVAAGSGRAAEAWAFLHRLSENELVDARDVVVQSEKKQDSLSEPAIDVLRTKGVLVERLGNWRIVTDGKEWQGRGVRRLESAKGAKKMEISNPSETRLYVSVLEEKRKEKKKPAPFSVDRQLFAFDGRRLGAGDPLQQDKVYLLVVQGRGKLDETSRQTLFLASVPSGAGLRVLAVSDSGIRDVFRENWPWLPSPLTSAEGAFSYGEGAGFVFQASGDWRFVCLVKAVEKGVYTLPPLKVRDLSGAERGTESNALRLTIR